MNGDPSKDCFENNKLKFENGEVEVDLESVEGLRWFRVGNPDSLSYTYKVQLSRDLTCSHCVLQWWWLGAEKQLYISEWFIRN